MTRRASLIFAALVAAQACDRDPVAPRPLDHQPSVAVTQDAGPPAPRSFGPDTRETEGPYTGQGVAKSGLKCSNAAVGRVCDGYLASAVDGTLLDVRLEIPDGTGPHPLVVLLHGWAGSKSGEGDIAADLIADGYAVLRYSARGFGDSWGRVNLADLHVELGDLRSMIAQVVDHNGYHLNADAVAVTGASYGGGQSWLALVQPTFLTPRRATVRIRTIVPIVPWTDLLYSLLPNGQPRSSLDPPGALKFSYVNALFFSGQREPGDGPEPWYDNYPAFLRAWHASLTTTEPTLNPLYPQIRDGLAGYRSIWWQQSFWATVTANPVPVFQVHGFTDDLFTLDEGKRMLLALKSVNPTYPIASYFGDLGHPRARNKPDEVAYALGLIRAWLAYYLKGAGTEPAHVIHAAITRPAAEPFNSANVITVPSYSDLETGVVKHTFDRTAVLTNPASGAPSGPFRDPVLEAGLVGAGELTQYLGPSPAPDPTAVAYELPVETLSGGAALLIAGQPTVTLSATTGAPRVQFNVRLFDVAPGGAAELVTRGTYTLDGGTSAPLGPRAVTISTQGNLWRAEPGHTLRLEITNVDFPYLAPSQVPSVTVISNVELAVPRR
ncbi:MAG: alpha/beta fold hydrolase [Gemmatimonadaceae bacterium]